MPAPYRVNSYRSDFKCFFPKPVFELTVNNECQLVLVNNRMQYINWLTNTNISFHTCLQWRPGECFFFFFFSAVGGGGGRARHKLLTPGPMSSVGQGHSAIYWTF